MVDQQFCFATADQPQTCVELLHHIAGHLNYSGVTRISIFEDPPKAELHFSNAENNNGFLLGLFGKVKSTFAGTKAEPVFSIAMVDIGDTGSYFKVIYGLNDHASSEVDTHLVDEIFKSVSDVTLHWPVD